MIEPGTRAPEFSLSDQDENKVTLSDFAGRKLVLADQMEAPARRAACRQSGRHAGDESAA